MCHCRSLEDFATSQEGIRYLFFKRNSLTPLLTPPSESRDFSIWSRKLIDGGRNPLLYNLLILLVTLVPEFYELPQAPPSRRLSEEEYKEFAAPLRALNVELQIDHPQLASVRRFSFAPFLVHATVFYHL